MNPWDAFASRVSGNIDTDEVSVYPGMAEQIVAPAIVLVTDDPWITTQAFQYDLEQYLAICIADAGNPADALDKLHRMVHAVRESEGEGFEIGDVSGVRTATIPDDGTRYLGSWVRFTYRDCSHAIEEGS